MELRALIFDFDGLILDTETPEVEVWQSIYRDHGFELPVDEWEKTIGGYGLSTFDAAEHLTRLASGQLDPDALRSRYRTAADRIIHANPMLPGVMEMIGQARKEGLKIAIGSSSSHSWVDAHIERLGIDHHFDSVVCSDDVEAGRTKPNPDIFLKALERLNVRNDEAVVFEDSPNGVLAARRAGVFVVAVPNPLTARMNVSGDLTITSLSELTLQDLRNKLLRIKLPSRQEWGKI